MEDRLSRIRRLSGIANMLIVIIQIILVVTLVVSVVAFVVNRAVYHTSAVFVGVSSLVGVVGVMGVMVLLSGLMKSLRNQRTPFDLQNAKRLRGVGVFLMGLAVVQFITDVVVAFSVSVMEVPSASGTVTVGFRSVAFHYTSLVLVVLGLAVLCISLAFEYGALLQQQSDETL